MDGHVARALVSSMPRLHALALYLDFCQSTRFFCSHPHLNMHSCIFCLCACLQGTSSDFGFELDSLCDLANFGVAPGMPMNMFFDLVVGCMMYSVLCGAEWAIGVHPNHHYHH